MDPIIKKDEKCIYHFGGVNLFLLHTSTRIEIEQMHPRKNNTSQTLSMMWEMYFEGCEFVNFHSHILVKSDTIWRRERVCNWFTQWLKVKAGLCCAVDDVESSSVAVGTTTIPVFQPQTILQVFVEEY